ncbi:zinc finger protein 583-like [Gracilinanus agilis]|uniref:zinc finger protein 583-like n=1 Tax=Gracilinanus agilis TaxID=191870 RepID=UPI001CFD89AA|nr:zinc finger protein 583-like [Gracilinanus agilis]
MLENMQNLLSVGLPVPRENFISCFQQGKAPWLLEQKDPRSSCPEAEISFQVKMSSKLNLFEEGSGPQRYMNEGLRDSQFLREICDSNIKVNKNPKNDCECDETAEKFSQYSVLNQYMKLSSGNDCCKDSKYRKCFPEEVGLVQSYEKPSEMSLYQGNLGGIAFGYSLDTIRHPKSKCVKLVSVSDKGGRPFSQNSELAAHQIIHFGEKPYECKQCGRVFTERGSLTAHQTVHTGEKPYECTQCGKAFKRKDYLTAHQTSFPRLIAYTCLPGEPGSWVSSSQRLFLLTLAAAAAAAASGGVQDQHPDYVHWSKNCLSNQLESCSSLWGEEGGGGGTPQGKKPGVL